MSNMQEQQPPFSTAEELFLKILSFFFDGKKLIPGETPTHDLPITCLVLSILSIMIGIRAWIRTYIQVNSQLLVDTLTSNVG